MVAAQTGISGTGRLGRAAQNQARRARILQAAGRLVLRYGFDKMTVEDITREAGISKGAFYLHFATKDAAMHALILEETWAYIDDFMAAIDADPLGATIPGMFRHSITVLVARPLSWAFYNRDVRVLGDFFRRNDPAMFRDRYLLNQDFMRAMQQLGLVREGIDTDALAYLLYLIRQGFLSMDPAAMGDSLPGIDRLLSLIGDVLGPYVTPAGLADTQAGKKFLHDLIDAYRSAMGGEEVRDLSQGNPGTDTAD